MTPDPGASAERTRLAWRRTGLSASAVALLAVRPAFAPRSGPAQWLVAAVALVGWAVLVGLTYRRAYGLRARPPRPGRRAVVAYALVSASFAVTGAMVVIL